MNPFSHSSAESAAKELRDYILSQGQHAINASHDYDEFFRNSASISYRTIIRYWRLKDFVIRFPSLLRWEAETVINGTNWIFAVINTQEQTALSFFTTNDESDFHPKIISDRQKLMSNGFLAKYMLKDYEFKWAYNLLATNTIRLSGVLATAPYSVSFVSLKEAILELLRYESDRYDMQGIDVFCYLVKEPKVSIEAFCYFSLVHPSNPDVLDNAFKYLVQDAIPKGQLRIGATVLTIDPRRQNTPFSPHNQTFSYIPDLIRARRNEFYLSKQTSDDGTDDGDTLTNESIDALCNATRGMALDEQAVHAADSTASGQLTARPSLPNDLPPLPNDLPPLTPEPYGHLELGLASCVINPDRLPELTRNQRQRFEELKVRVSDISSDRARTAWWYHNTEEGTFVLYKHSVFLVGEGSEAKVYLGGYLEGEYASTDRDVIRQNFAEHARGIAVKQYFTKESKIEINTFRMLPRNADGIINYLASFEMHDDLYTVQELGLVSLSDRVASEASFQERLRMVRGACLAVRELHRRSGGPIVHRDIRLPNFLLSDSGRIKICDFGISRILSDSKKTVKTKSGALAYLSFQPYEVQTAIDDLLKKREQRAKLAKGADWEENDSYIPISPSSDIFMLGLVLYRLVLEKDAMTNEDICQQREADLTELLGLFSGGRLLAHLLEFMLSHTASRRPTIEQVLEHPFFRSWNDNHMLVQGLYKELHDGEGVTYSDNFRLLENMLTPLEQEVDWTPLLANLPPNLAAKIRISKTIPMLKDKDDGDSTRPHTLPQLHAAIQWLRHFFTHFTDTASLVHFHRELRAGVKEGEALGEFIYSHASLSWVLPGLWKMRLHFLQRLKQEEDEWDQQWLDLQRHDEEKRNNFSDQKRKMKGLFALSL